MAMAVTCLGGGLRALEGVSSVGPRTLRAVAGCPLPPRLGLGDGASGPEACASYSGLKVDLTHPAGHDQGPKRGPGAGAEEAGEEGGPRLAGP